MTVLKRLRHLLADHGRDAAGVIALAVILATVWIILSRAHAERIRGCAAAYAQAVTAADTARVDARQAPGMIRPGHTCGSLRARGELP